MKKQLSTIEKLFPLWVLIVLVLGLDFFDSKSIATWIKLTIQIGSLILCAISVYRLIKRDFRS